ncbi:MarR family transcriptional regulator [Pedobacter yulinensis]|uniref:MarR family transcriptional regulator n=1 Tax=Pedobacter yulinensis TaxID=2126353 RepID=A0A2T3HHE5_9SPHI|nr:MarR family transcriptional regulator [Pedobacter yulinensis]PST81823.1 MarR family transcriptional regulator [Pedobacter yulinensis]
MNIINEAGLLALATRLQRLSERIRKDGALIYKESGIDFEPKWFPVVYALHVKSSLSVVAIAAEIGYTHPSTIGLLKELEKNKLIVSRRDKQDERKRLIQLSKKGKDLVDRMQPVWNLITEATAQLTLTQHNIMQAIEEVEAELNRQSFLQRARQLKSE